MRGSIINTKQGRRLGNPLFLPEYVEYPPKAVVPAEEDWLRPETIVTPGETSVGDVV
jgi:hypothetical protein